MRSRLWLAVALVVSVFLLSVIIAVVNYQSIHKDWAGQESPEAAVSQKDLLQSVRMFELSESKADVFQDFIESDRPSVAVAAEAVREDAGGSGPALFPASQTSIRPSYPRATADSIVLASHTIAGPRQETRRAHESSESSVVWLIGTIEEVSD